MSGVWILHPNYAFSMTHSVSVNLDRFRISSRSVFQNLPINPNQMRIFPWICVHLSGISSINCGCSLKDRILTRIPQLRRKWPQLNWRLQIVRKDTEQSTQKQRTSCEGLEMAEHAEKVSCSGDHWAAVVTLLQQWRLSRSVTPRRAGD